MATDLAEFVGAAIALNLLFGVPLFPAGLITAVVAFGDPRAAEPRLPALRARDRRLPARDHPARLPLRHAADRLRRRRRPPRASSRASTGTDSVLLATGILGATVMPHVIYLHSALTQDRIRPRDDAESRALLRFQRIDVTIAMGVAGLVNMSMLIIAASLFHDARPDRRRHDRGRPRAASRTLVGAAARRSPSRSRCWPPGLASLERRHLRRPGRDAGLHRAGGSRWRCAARSRWRRR